MSACLLSTPSKNIIFLLSRYSTAGVTTTYPYLCNASVLSIPVILFFRVVWRRRSVSSNQVIDYVSEHKV